MPTTEEKERRKSSADAHKNHQKKEERRKSTVTKLWNWISAKKDEGHSKDDSDIKHKKHRAVKKTHRSYTAAVDGHYDYSDDSDSDIHRNPPLRRHVSAQPTAPLTPPESPDLSYEDGETDSSPSNPKAVEAANDETSQIERKLTNVEQKSKPKPPSRGSHGGSKSRSSGSGARPKQQAMMKPRGSPKTDSGNRRRRKRRNRAVGNVNTNVPLEYPCTPELILEYHKSKSFLTQNEEWLVVELNEYECLIESIDMIHMMAKFSKMFEMDPPEFLEEFFEFVDEVPSYDEVINTDVWQEFRDVKYPY